MRYHVVWGGLTSTSGGQDNQTEPGTIWGRESKFEIKKEFKMQNEVTIQLCSYYYTIYSSGNGNNKIIIQINWALTT